MHFNVVLAELGITIFSNFLCLNIFVGLVRVIRGKTLTHVKLNILKAFNYIFITNLYL